ncbi:MAG: hypothetical protein ACHQ2F_01075 [Desulfobaccales bacterium]
MDEPKTVGLIESLQNPLVISFLLQLHFLCGELEGFNIIGKVLPASRPTLVEARQAIVSKIKAVFEAFDVKARQDLNQEPGEVVAWRVLALETFKSLREELAQAQSDPELLAGLLAPDHPDNRYWN